MLCTDTASRPDAALALRRSAMALLLLSFVGCSTPPRPPRSLPAETSPIPILPGPPGTPPRLGEPLTMRNWTEVRLQAARRMLAANPDISYSGAAPEPLLAIPVLEIELNGDGSIRRIGVLRQPSQAQDTTQIAIDAVRRAAPFGKVSHLTKPWKFTETFLFDEERRFKPRVLDE